ncbi:hypothetical protein RHMOL_Rhmol05G0032100 [Rhododendron molle]|uniref:Uncharacterized protein n=1 Tax=Rhododendron molle TaxID=49168 RepID=A0ACC0NJW3_RHOML|nr:hypothetical protein RHMOL_Rhmol05G0032100 [Rhododendron molle]
MMPTLTDLTLEFIRLDDEDLSKVNSCFPSLQKVVVEDRWVKAAVVAEAADRCRRRSSRSLLSEEQRIVVVVVEPPAA